MTSNLSLRVFELDKKGAFLLEASVFVLCTREKKLSNRDEPSTFKNRLFFFQRSWKKEKPNHRVRT